MEFEDDFVFSVYLKEDILKNIQKLCKRTNLEIFGYLVGEIFAWKGKNYILIEDHLFLKAATASEQYTVSQIDGTAGKFDERFQKLKKKRKNGELRIVGWWHSHPDFGCFLSTTDVETQRFFFPEDYQVALVVDPIRDEFEFFNLDDDSSKGYKKISWALINSE